MSVVVRNIIVKRLVGRAVPRRHIPPLVVVCVVVVELAGGVTGAEVELSSVVVVVEEEAGIELSLAQPARVNNPAAARDERINVFMSFEV
jgi:hypothetical protein